MTADAPAKPMSRRPGRLRGMLLAVLTVMALGVARPAQAACFFPVCWNFGCLLANAIEEIFEDILQEATTVLYLGYVRPIPADTCTGLPEAGGNAGFPPGSVLYDFMGWMIFDYFDNYIGAALLNMGQQFTNDIIQQTSAIGAFLDAKNQLETQQLFQELAAKAHKDYQPSYGMCVFGTAMRSIVTADYNNEYTNFFLSRYQQNREMQNINSKSAEGPVSDAMSRLREFADKFCDVNDNDPIPGNASTGLGLVCNASPTAKTKNSDIDYMRTVLRPRTLELDFSDGTRTDDEQAVLAMSSNLYASELFDNVSRLMGSNLEHQRTYMSVRSVIAKRSVAEASFNAVIGMKTQGSAASAAGGAAKTAAYLGVLLDELGMPATDIPIWLGAQPSYMAQLEMVAKKMYQRPEFYMELYESPANVKRRSVAMQAIEVMMGRDIYKSYMRSEMIMAVLLETRLLSYQHDVGNRLGKLSATAPQ